jgi:hypothetical protein
MRRNYGWRVRPRGSSRHSIARERRFRRSRRTRTPAPWYEGIEAHVFVGTSWSYNFNRPDSRTNTLRVFDFDDNSIKLDQVELSMQKTAPEPGDAGFRFDLCAGGSVPRVTAASGLFRDASGTAQDIDLQQGFVTWNAPVGGGLRFDAGKFVTPFGYEVIDGYDAFNDNATRSFLFGYAIPFTHVGLRANLGLGHGVAGTLMVVNGWDVATDNNRGKSVGGQLALVPTIASRPMPPSWSGQSDPATIPTCARPTA